MSQSFEQRALCESDFDVRCDADALKSLSGSGHEIGDGIEKHVAVRERRILGLAALHSFVRVPMTQARPVS